MYQCCVLQEVKECFRSSLHFDTSSFNAKYDALGSIKVEEVSLCLAIASRRRL